MRTKKANEHPVFTYRLNDETSIDVVSVFSRENMKLKSFSFNGQTKEYIIPSLEEIKKVAVYSKGDQYYIPFSELRSVNNTESVLKVDPLSDGVLTNHVSDIDSVLEKARTILTSSSYPSVVTLSDIKEICFHLINYIQKDIDYQIAELGRRQAELYEKKNKLLNR